MKLKHFKNPDPNFVEGNFKTTKHPKSISPKRRDYSKKAITRPDLSTRCTYIHGITGKRCRNLLGIYPRFCELHTTLIENVYISPSQITLAGNGLYAGPFGFKKGDVIGEYSMPWNQVSEKTLEKRCDNSKCLSYVFCDHHSNCWDALDIRSTIIRNINDAHGSKFRNNAYFDVIDGHVYAIASRNIKPGKEILVSYGSSYW
jgi:hypothetical protein